jgi:hypothetical protein
MSSLKDLEAMNDSLRKNKATKHTAANELATINKKLVSKSPKGKKLSRVQRFEMVRKIAKDIFR